jgi:uncharacterized protein (TIGR03790 family)
MLNTPAGEGGYPVESFLISDPHGFTYAGDGFYLQGDVDFVPGAFQVCYDPTWTQENSGDEVPYTLDYLVGRLDAYNLTDAKAMVDRSLAADSSGDGWVVFDSSDGDYGWPPIGQNFLDTMVDPVWPYLTDGAALCGQELLSAAGFKVFADKTLERITTDSILLPLDFDNNVIAYAGWGVNHVGGDWEHSNEYILEDLGWNYLPGACCMSYESFSGTDFSSADPDNDRSDIFRRGQGQLCDFLHMGATVGFGNAWEPFTNGMGDERWAYDRYLNHGDRWIEAAYKGVQMISWQTVVAGDPLCRVK